MMKNLIFTLFIGAATLMQAQTTKSKNLQIKYTPPAGWNAEEFGGKTPWEDDGGNALCKCAGVHFYRTHKEGKLHVVLYPSTQSGLDSAKRNGVGELVFQDIVQFDRVRSKEISYERKKSNFVNSTSKEKSYEVYRYFAKLENNRFLIIYAWQENMQPLTTNENELFQMIKGVEAN